MPTQMKTLRRNYRKYMTTIEEGSMAPSFKQLAKDQEDGPFIISEAHRLANLHTIEKAKTYRRGGMPKKAKGGVKKKKDDKTSATEE